jgi:hypothetical protein
MLSATKRCGMFFVTNAAEWSLVGIVDRIC